MNQYLHDLNLNVRPNECVKDDLLGLQQLSMLIESIERSMYDKIVCISLPFQRQ
jgi:hypothetical protein